MTATMWVFGAVICLVFLSAEARNLPGYEIGYPGDAPVAGSAGGTGGAVGGVGGVAGRPVLVYYPGNPLANHLPFQFGYPRFASYPQVPYYPHGLAPYGYPPYQPHVGYGDAAATTTTTMAGATDSTTDSTTSETTTTPTPDTSTTSMSSTTSATDSTTIESTTMETTTTPDITTQGPQQPRTYPPGSHTQRCIPGSTIRYEADPQYYLQCNHDSFLLRRCAPGTVFCGSINVCCRHTHVGGQYNLPRPSYYPTNPVHPVPAMPAQTAYGPVGYGARDAGEVDAAEEAAPVAEAEMKMMDTGAGDMDTSLPKLAMPVEIPQEQIPENMGPDPSENAIDSRDIFKGFGPDTGMKFPFSGLSEQPVEGGGSAFVTDQATGKVHEFQLPWMGEDQKQLNINIVLESEK